MQKRLSICENVRKSSKFGDSAISAKMEPVKLVKLDALAVLKISKHSKEFYPESVYGCLMGVNCTDGVLEVTHSFPQSKHDDDDIYITDMLKKLSEVNLDVNLVGWYQSCWQGSVNTEQLIMAQLEYQRELPYSCVIVYDPVQAYIGKCPFKAYTLCQKCLLLDQYDGESRGGGLELGVVGKLNDILEEIEIQINTPVLGETFLLDWFPSYKWMEDNQPVNFDSLDFENSGYLEKNLYFLNDLMDELLVEQQRNPQDAKRRGKDSWRNTQSNPLELLTVSNQIQKTCANINSSAGANLGKLFLLNETAKKMAGLG
eukprot:GHVL01003708.1.p1 GENE.GHVL01003708.1~~GHVL01003708.1.p1  ORF type:complete len:315 (-),score=59.16 GHVL01003708.1:440-1384(-)